MPATKRCRKCSQTKSPGEFHRDKKAKDGLVSRCKSCQHEHDRQPRVMARMAFGAIKQRERNSDGKNPTYAAVELRIARTDFIEWYLVALAEFVAGHGGAKQSVDRIDDDGHYELSNIRMIPMVANTRRQRRNKNVHAKAGEAWCGKCRQYLPADEFHKNANHFNGLCTLCKKCTHLSYLARIS